MDISDVLLLTGVQAWCDDCGGERILVPADDSDVPSGCYCCTACDGAVFVLPVADAPAALRRPA